MQNPDSIDSLPVDSSPPSETDIKMVNMLFGSEKSNIEKIREEGKDIIVMGILFSLFLFPQMDRFIIGVFPIAGSSQYSLILAKAVIFSLLYFFVKNIRK